MYPRRTFLSLSAAASIAAVFPKSIFAEQPRTNLYTSQSLGAYTQGLMTQSNFATRIGEVFTAFHADDSVSYLTLRKVVSLGPDTTTTQVQAPGAPTVTARRIVAPRQAPYTQQLSSFYAAFEVTGAPVVQESLLLDSGTMGRFTAFVVPGISAGGATTCAATFTTLVTAQSLSPQQLLQLPTLSRAQR